MREDVLKLEYQNVFEDMVACRVTYQNEKVLKRGEFGDEEFKVYSKCFPSFYSNEEKSELCIRGYGENRDNKVFIVTKDEAEIIKDKVEKINKKYGIKKRWRAKEGECYFVVDIFYNTTAYYYESNSPVDKRLYDSGNYFKTEEQAEVALEKIKRTLEQYKEELLKDK